MNELTQAQYKAVFGISNQHNWFEGILKEYFPDVPYTMRNLPFGSYPMVYLENLPAELAEMCPPIEQHID